MTAVSGSVVVAGVGLRQYKRGHAPLTQQGVVVRAIEDACIDAGIPTAEVDGFVSYGNDANEPLRLMPELGTEEIRFAAQVWGGGGGGLAGAFGLAAAAIASGQAKVIVAYRALVQQKSGRLSEAIVGDHLNDHMKAAGVVSPAQVCALRAQRMFSEHPQAAQAVLETVRASYHHGARNPEAASFGQDFDIDAYHLSRYIVDPFRLYDCSRENDGAGVLLFVGGERARDMKSKPIYLLGAETGTEKGWGDLIENDVKYISAGFQPVARRLWEKTGLRPQDIDVAQIYENFSAQGVAALIDHGFCNYENLSEVLRFENLIAPTGKLPINTSGGNLADGFVHGIGLAVEAIRQLRGQSANPVPDAKTCLVTGGPSAPLVSSAIFATEPT